MHCSCSLNPILYVGPTSYGNQSSLISVSTDHSEMDGGDDHFNKRPYLKKIAPRQQVKRPVEGTEKKYDQDFVSADVKTKENMKLNLILIVISRRFFLRKYGVFFL